MAFPGPNELSVIARCQYYRGVLKERLDCSYLGKPEIVMEIMAYPKAGLDPGPWSLDS